MVITAEEYGEISETRTEDERKRAAAIKIRNRLGVINRIVEANVEGETGLLAADASWYKSRIDGCPVA